MTCNCPNVSKEHPDKIEQLHALMAEVVSPIRMCRRPCGHQSIGILDSDGEWSEAHQTAWARALALMGLPEPNGELAHASDYELIR